MIVLDRLLLHDQTVVAVTSRGAGSEDANQISADLAENVARFDSTTREVELRDSPSTRTTDELTTWRQ